MLNLQWALKYQKLGWSVIPLKPKSKEPLIDWKEFQSRIANEEEIKEWFIQCPLINVAVVTGRISNLAVIDADGSTGLLSLEHLKIHSPVIALSGNGRHLWYKWINGIKNSASKIAPGIDIRGDGGFVVAPPSVHPNGKRYRWLNDGLLKPDILLPSFPTELCFAQNAVLETSNKQDSWITEALEEMRNGHIHNTLVSVLGKFRHHNFSIDDTYTLLRPHAMENGKPFEGLKSKIEEIWGRYEAAPATLEVYNDSDSESIETFFETEEEVKWIIPGLIAANSLGFVVGLPETSKTWACMDLAIEVANGGQWLGTFKSAKTKVWFIDQERYRGETKRRFKALFAAKGLKPKEVPDLRINSGNTTFKLDLDQSFTAFRKQLEKTRPGLIIVDSLACFHTKEENNRKDIQEVLERVKALRNEFNCTFLFIHHENKLSFQSKEEGKEPSLAEMAGNIAIPAAAETVITVRKRIDGSSLVYHTKSTMSKQHTPFEIRVNDVGGPDKIEVKGYL